MKFKSEYIAPIGSGNEVYEINTGDWRIQRPVMDMEKCVRCGKCFLYCPVSSIIKEDDVYKITYGYCKGCGICAYECPVKAINMVQEEGK